MPVSVTYPGVYVQEAPSGVRTISGVATSVAAFVGMFPSGPVGAPTRVFSAREFDALFGGDVDVGEAVHQVRQFFLNGGPQAWIVRTAANAGNGTSLMAASTIQNETANQAAFTILAKNAGSLGNSIRVEVDYGTASPERSFNLTEYRIVVKSDGSVERVDETVFRNLSMDPGSARYAKTIVNATSTLISLTDLPDDLGVAPANLAGFSQSALVFTLVDAETQAALAALIDGTHNQMMVSVAGGAAVRATLAAPAGGATAAQMLDAIALAINNALGNASQAETVTASFEAVAGGRSLRIANTNGPVIVTAAAANDVAANLQLGTENDGIEFDGFSTFRPAPTGYVTRVHTAASPLSRIEHFAAIDKTNFAQWTLTGAQGTFNGAAATFGTPGTMVVGPTFAMANTVGSLKNVKTNLGTIASQIPAATGNIYAARVDGYRLVVTPLYGDHNADLDLRLSNSGGGADSITGNSDIAPNAVGPDNTVAYAIGSAAGVPGPAAGAYRALVRAGNDGQPPLPGDYDAAYVVLEREADIFNMLILPRARGTNVQSDADRGNLWGAASAFCKKRRAFLIVDPQSDGTAWSTANGATNGAKAMRSGLQLDHAAIYWPRVKISDPKGKPLTIDPSGTLAGVYAATDVKRGVWKAPAGLEALLIGVRGLQYNVTDDENGITNPQALNTLRSMSTGSVSWGARTMMGFDEAPDQDWKYIPVRRLALYIEESLYRGFKFAVFEPNAEPLWAQIRLAGGAFMNNLFRQGAFKGTKSTDAYYVACDATTTRQNDINLGIVNIEIGFAPLKPAEFVVLTIKQLAGQIEV